MAKRHKGFHGRSEQMVPVDMPTDLAGSEAPEGEKGVDVVLDAVEELLDDREATTVEVLEVVPDVVEAPAEVVLPSKDVSREGTPPPKRKRSKRSASKAAVISGLGDESGLGLELPHWTMTRR